MSVIGQEAGLDHGSMRGYRQHTYRQVPACEECLAAVREDSRRRHKARQTQSPSEGTKARQKRQKWNRGMVGAAAQGRDVRLLAGACPVDECGQLADQPCPRPGMVRVHVAASREAAKWYCPGWCALYGEALADVRTLGGDPR